MAAREFSPQDLQKIHDLAHQWGKIVVRHAFGDEGPGLEVDLAAMEEVAVAAARGLTAGALEQATAQQARRLGEALPCPRCGQPLVSAATTPSRVGCGQGMSPAN